MGGLNKFHFADENELLTWGRKQFIETYKNLEGSDLSCTPTHCMGRTELENLNNPPQLQYEFKTVDLTGAMKLMLVGKLSPLALRRGDGSDG